jgi:hypothetical protein
MEKNELETIVNGHTRTLYGSDGRSGLVRDVESKIDKDMLNSYMKRPPLIMVTFLFSVLIIPIACIGIKVWSAQESNSLKYSTIESVQGIEKRTIRIEERYEHIQETLTRLEKKLDRLNNN